MRRLGDEAHNLKINLNDAEHIQQQCFDPLAGSSRHTKNYYNVATPNFEILNLGLNI